MKTEKFEFYREEKFIFGYGEATPRFSERDVLDFLAKWSKGKDVRIYKHSLERVEENIGKYPELDNKPRITRCDLVYYIHIYYHDNLIHKIVRLENAIRKHRDMRGDDRCWLDDEELYGVLYEGYTPPKRDTKVELELCKKFINCRKNPKTEYVSPQREIERLEKENSELKEKIKNLEERLTN